MTVEEFLAQQNIAVPNVPPPEAMPSGVAGFTPQGAPIAAPNIPAQPPITQRPSSWQTAKDIGGQLALGAAGPALGEAAAIKAFPGLGERGLLRGAGRVLGAGGGGAAVGALQGDPAGGAVQGALAGLTGEAVNWGAGKVGESVMGGPYGRLARYVNNIGKLTGLGTLIENPRQEGAKAYSLFRTKPEGGSATSKNPVDVFERTIYAPVKGQVDAAFPPGGIQVPTMDRLIAQRKVGAIPVDALERNDYTRKAHTESQFLKFQGPAGLQAAKQTNRYAFLNTPYEWTFRDIDDTIKALNNQGYGATGDPRSSIPSAASHQDAHNLVDEVHQWLSTNGQPRLADTWRQKRNHMLGLNTMGHILEQANLPELGGAKEFGKLQAVIVGNQGTLQRSFGPDFELSQRKLITRGVEDPKYYDRPPGIHPSGGVSSSGIHLFPHISLGQTLRPDIVAGSLPQMLKSGIPGALLNLYQRYLGQPQQPPSPAQEEY